MGGALHHAWLAHAASVCRAQLAPVPWLWRVVV